MESDDDSYEEPLHSLLPWAWVAYITAEIDGRRRPVASLCFMQANVPGHDEVYALAPTDVANIMRLAPRFWADERRWPTEPLEFWDRIKYGPSGEVDHVNDLDFAHFMNFMNGVDMPNEALDANAVGVSDEVDDMSGVGALKLMENVQKEFKQRYGTFCAFPLITSLLLDGAHAAKGQPDPYTWIPAPIDKSYLAADPDYGALIIDITDLDRISHGVVVSKDVFDRLEPEAGDLPSSADATWSLDEEERAIIPIQRYMRLASTVLEPEIMKMYGRAAEAYREMPTLPSYVLGGKCARTQTTNSRMPDANVRPQDMWPRQVSDDEPKPKRRKNPKAERGSLVDMCINTLVHGKQNGVAVDFEELKRLDYIPNLKQNISRALTYCGSMESDAQRIAELVRFIFADADHLALGAIQGLSYSALASVLTTEELRNASTLDLSVDAIHGSPKALWPALLSMPRLERIFLLTNPDLSEAHDNIVKHHLEFFEEMMRNDEAMRLQGKLFSNGLYALAFERKPVFDPLHKLSSLSPLHSIYYCRLPDSHNIYHGYGSYAIDHMMLAAETVVARMMRWVRDECFMQYPSDFAYGPDHLTSTPDEFTLRPQPREVATYPENDIQFVKLMPHRQWILLFEEEDKRVKYAFVRLENGDSSRNLVACSAREFLAIEAPGVDTSGLSAMLEDADLRLLAYPDTTDYLRRFFRMPSYAAFQHYDRITAVDYEHLRRWRQYPPYDRFHGCISSLPISAPTVEDLEAIKGAEGRARTRHLAVEVEARMQEEYALPIEELD
ncbi:hypothetical protein NLG97_g9126 [Lecanicillium saksenae]|uniref:Uncharacterized protein n=1 Tax=Lecanicillium saksenae TaxID=468837 RepID=A0ACC1QKT6_9HYPO|nr:hypothetical protein NLG97_g9126 [Lecanicillium saksenae]